MGTTLAALNSGSTSIAMVAAIEGYDELFTEYHDTTAVATAWSGTGWTSVRGGLCHDLEIAQSMDPNEPFMDTGSCVLMMVPVANGASDLFGVAVGRKTSPYETYLAATLNNTATTVTVKSTSGWPSSGTLHIGTECIAYTGTTATTFTGCTRGKYSTLGSFANQVAPAATKSFGHYHRVTDDALAINLAPLVTSKPRMWIGRWVTVYAHRIVSGVLDTKDEAELVFAGTIVDIRDDPNTGAVVMQLQSAVEVFKESVIGSSQWNAALEDDGVYLAAGDTFGFSDHNGTTQEDANSLVVVASGATGTNQINEGVYSLGDLCSALSAWTAAETTAARLHGSYSFASPVSTSSGGYLTKVYWTLTGAPVVWIWSMPKIVSVFLGFGGIAEIDPSPSYPDNYRVWHSDPGGGSAQHWHAGDNPMRVAFTVNASSSSRVLLTTKSGTVVDNPHLPSAFKSPLANLLGGAANVGDWGVFEFDGNGKRLMLAEITDNADGTVLLSNIRPAYYFTPDGAPSSQPLAFQYGSDDTLRVRQVYAFENTPSVLITLLAVSTGTDEYNSPYVDTLPLGCGAGVPFEAVDTLQTSLSRVTSGVGKITTIIEKPTKMSELIRADMAVRWAAFCWHQGSVTAVQWRTPTAQLALLSGISLTDSNKAEPSGHKVNHKAATSETSEWLRPVVKIRYSRDISEANGDDYAQNLSFMDETSIDDMGGARNSITINLRNTYRQTLGQSLDSVLAAFFETLPLVSRPARKITRSIDSRYFWQIAPGDIVLVTDTFARDPETGLRGLSARPALVTKVKWSLGGGDVSGSVQPMGGEIELLFSDRNPARFAPYVPAGMVNDLYTLGSFDHGYNSSGPSLELLGNRFTETTDTGGRDSAYFNPGDKIIIIERDPADPDAPVKWERTIATGGVSGNTITLTATLSSPAFDNTKQYYVISQTYSATTATQHLNTYQADEADALIEDSTGPYYYGSSSASATYTTNDGIDDVYPFSSVNTIEMPPTLVRTDGAGRDVAHEAALVRLANNLIDYKLAPQFPMLSNTVMSNTTVTGTGRLLVAYWPVFLTFENLNTFIQRYMTIAPLAYSTDGTSTKIRVTVSRERPSFPTTENVTWTGTYSQYEWTGITSTTPAVLADSTLPVLKSQLGEAWISVELGYKCATRLLSKCWVNPRQVVFLVEV